MCSSKPKYEKPKPPAPPAPPPEQSAATTQGIPEPKSMQTSGNETTKSKRKGRSSLRIDLNTAGGSNGNGLNIPV